jgi:uncharacterized protein with HEPN domain
VPSDRKEERERLGHIVANIDRIGGHIAGRSFEQFETDPMLADAVERCLQRITEASIRIGAARMAEIAPGVPFAEVRGLGNILRHEYEKIDLATVWDTVRHDLPALRAACAEALGETRGF